MRTALACPEPPERDPKPSPPSVTLSAGGLHWPLTTTTTSPIVMRAHCGEAVAAWPPR